MTNPPINWGYPRVVEGFKHTLTRSHYERVSTVDNLADYVRQVGTCVSVSSSGFGWNGTVIGAAAALGFFIIRGAALRWLLGLLVLHLTMGLLLTAILSPWKSIESVRAVAPYLTATHLPLAILVGAGLMLLAACCLGIRERRLRSEATVDADEPRPSAAL